MVRTAAIDLIIFDIALLKRAAESQGHEQAKPREASARTQMLLVLRTPAEGNLGDPD